MAFQQPIQPVFIAGHFDSTGTIVPGNSNGELPQVEKNSAAINAKLANVEGNERYNRDGLVNVSPAGGGGSSANAQKRFVGISATLVGGSLANVVILPALAGFTGYIQPYALWSDTADEFTLAFQDEDDAALLPAAVVALQVDVKHPNEAAPIGGTHGVAGDNSGAPIFPLVFQGIADNKALEVDISGGTGGEEMGVFLKRWYET